MVRSSFRVAAALSSEDGTPLAQLPLEVDWLPALEWVRLQAVRRGRSGAHTFVRAGRVEPVWDADRRAPHVAGLRVRLAGRSGEPDDPTDDDAVHDFPTTYLTEAVRSASAALLEDGVLEEGDRFTFRALAFPLGEELDEEGADADEAPRPRLFGSRRSAPMAEIARGSLERLAECSERVGPERPGEMPLFVGSDVLEEARRLALEADGRETGGILIGHVRHDAGVPEAFVEVTAQIHAREAKGEADRLTFTPEAWSAVAAAQELRGRGEIMVGWWHSHPVREWCRECSEESRKRCALREDFLSVHDRTLHRTVFPRAYSVALVVNDIGKGGPTLSMFGWREGRIEPRGFHVPVARRATKEACDAA